MSEPGNFRQVRLGCTDMVVSSVGYGTYHLREKLGSADAIDSLGQAYQAGVTLFDASDNYGTEELIGQAVRERAIERDQVVIATKTGLATSVKEHLEWRTANRKVDTSAKRIRRQVDKSLRLLGSAVGVIDLYQLHVGDAAVPAEEHAGVMNELIQAGKIRAYGVSNYSAKGLSDLLEVCKTEGLEPPVSSQPLFNVLYGPGKDSAVALEAGMTLIAHSPLCKGMLVDVMVDEVRDAVRTAREGAVGTKKADTLEESLRPLEMGLDCLDGLRSYAASQGLTLAQFAIGWVAAHPNTVVLSACTSQEYLDDARIGAATRQVYDAQEIEPIRLDLEKLRFWKRADELMRSMKLYYH